MFGPYLQDVCYIKTICTASGIYCDYNPDFRGCTCLWPKHTFSAGGIGFRPDFHAWLYRALAAARTLAWASLLNQQSSVHAAASEPRGNTTQQLYYTSGLSQAPATAEHESGKTREFSRHKHELAYRGEHNKISGKLYFFASENSFYDVLLMISVYVKEITIIIILLLLLLL